MLGKMFFWNKWLKEDSEEDSSDEDENRNENKPTQKRTRIRRQKQESKEAKGIEVVMKARKNTIQEVTKKYPPVVIPNVVERSEDLDLFNSEEPMWALRPRVVYWVPENLPFRKRKSLPGLSILGRFTRFYIEQNGAERFNVISNGLTLFQGVESIPPGRRTITLYDGSNAPVMSIERVGKDGCNVICSGNHNLIGSILAVGKKKKRSYVLANEDSEKIGLIEKISKSITFDDGQEKGLLPSIPGLLEYEFRTVEEEPIGGGIFFMATRKRFGKLDHPKTCSLRCPDKIGPAEKALFLAAAFFFDMVEFKLIKKDQAEEEVVVVKFPNTSGGN